MKRFLSFLLAFSGILVSCQSPVHSNTSENQTDPLDISSEDSSVKPQENFYLFANGTWLKNTQIPPAQSAWGAFVILRDSTTVRLHRILDSLTGVSGAPKGSVAQQTGDLYASAMDSIGIEKKGFLPIKEELDSIGAIKNKTGLYQEIAKEYAINHGPFFNFFVQPDDRNSMVNAAHFNQGGLGLPSKDYYFIKDSAIAHIRQAYIAYITKTFTLIGQSPSNAAAAAQSVFNLETAIAKISKSPEQLRDPIANYNKIVVSDKPELKKWLLLLGVTNDTILVGQPAFFKGLNVILNNTPMETLKTYLCFHVVNDDADYLSHDFVDAKFSYEQLLTGQKVMLERWKRMTNMVDNQLGDNLGQIYVQQYFKQADKERIGTLVDNIVSTYAERIQQLDWMSDSTKQKALIKLHAIVKKIGFPDKWKDYSSIDITKDNIIANLKGTANYQYKRDLAKIGKPVDRTEWQMTPPTINAYYDPTQNNINFPAGILQPPFYFSNGDDAVNYGAIGLVIGHEITHGFDDQGRQYDADGNLKEWWSPNDAIQFKKRAQNIINQYNHYIAVDTFHLNGSLTEGENIADNGGIALAYAAFKKTEQGKGNEKIDGFTPDQRFFLSHAQVWKTKTREAALISRALTDPHSSAMWRVNGPLSNMPAFYAAFNVQPSDSMYRPDSVRVKIW
jgi:putative endopeptidase